VGEIAGELIHVGQAALASNESIDTFIHRTFNVPTFSETYKYAAYDGLQRLSGRQTVIPTPSDERSEGCRSLRIKGRSGSEDVN
jgi:hypothetical protein